MSGGVQPVHPERVLVRCPNWLGDVVMVTPALRALRRQYPDAKIVAQLPAPLIPLLGGFDSCDEVWELRSRVGGLAGWRADSRRIAEAQFDLGVVIPESVSSALLMRLGRVSRIVGFGRDSLRNGLLHEVISTPLAWGRRRMVSKERYSMRLIDSLDGGTRADFDGEELRTELVVEAKDKEQLDLALARAGIERKHWGQVSPIVLAPGASYGEAKCWPVESYAALADRIVGRGLNVVLLGGPGESERIRSVRSAMREEAVVLDGVLDVGGLKALMKGARGLVGNDAGARHVAAAFGVPSVIFFGPTSVAKTADNLSRIEVLETQDECRPCYRRECPIDHRCLRSIDVDTAAEAMERLPGVFDGAGS